LMGLLVSTMAEAKKVLTREPAKWRGLNLPVGAYLACRLCLMLPAVAIGKWLSPQEAGKMSEGNGGNSFVCVGIVPLLLLPPSGIVGIYGTFVAQVLVALLSLHAANTHLLMFSDLRLPRFRTRILLPSYPFS